MFLSKRTGRLISVEHDPVWFDSVSNKLVTEQICNCDLIHKAPKHVGKKISTSSQLSYASCREEYRGLSFENYVRCIDDFEDRKFDLVMIDGRARAACVAHAIKKIRPGGHILFDDSEREEFEAALSILSKYKRTDFFGASPYLDYLKQTSIWEIHQNKAFSMAEGWH